MRQSLVLQVTGPAILITDALSGTQGGTQGLFQESSRSLPVFVFLKCQPFSLLVSLVARCPRILNVLICPSRSKGCYPIHHGSQRYIFPRRQLDAFLPLSNPHCDTQSTSCIGSMLPYVATWQCSGAKAQGCLILDMNCDPLELWLKRWLQTSHLTCIKYIPMQITTLSTFLSETLWIEYQPWKYMEILYTAYNFLVLDILIKYCLGSYIGSELGILQASPSPQFPIYFEPLCVSLLHLGLPKCRLCHLF